MFRKWFSKSDSEGKRPWRPMALGAQADGSLGLIKAVQAGDLKTVTELVEAGVNLRQQDERGATALHHAVCGHYEIAEFLLSRGVNTEVTDCDRLTPLHVAFLRQDRSMMELLVKHGADFDKPLPDGRTLATVAREWHE